jgi:hypothetical protein
MGWVFCHVGDGVLIGSQVGCDVLHKLLISWYMALCSLMCCLSAFACQLLVQYNQLAGKLWNAAVVEDVAALHCYQLFAGLFLL